MDYFGRLPPEVVLHVFGFLPASTLMRSVSLVSRSFRDLARCDRLWTAVEYQYGSETVKSFSKFLRKRRRVREMTLAFVGSPRRHPCCPDHDLPELPLLTKMVLSGTNDFNFTHLKNSYSNLRELELIHVNLCEFHESFEGTERQYDRKCSTEDCSALEHVCKKFRKLRKLSIAYHECYLHDPSCVEWNSLRFSCDTLKELKIEHPFLIRSDLKKITKSCPLLETFHFRTLCSLSDISEMLGRLSSLRDLAVIGLGLSYRYHNPKTSEEIAKDMCDLFRRLPELVRCKFSRIDQFDDAALGHATEHCKKLEIVELSNLPRVTEAGIARLIAGLKNLKELRVRDCFNCDV